MFKQYSHSFALRSLPLTITGSLTTHKRIRRSSFSGSNESNGRHRQLWRVARERYSKDTIQINQSINQSVIDHLT